MAPSGIVKDCVVMGGGSGWIHSCKSGRNLLCSGIRMRDVGADEQELTHLSPACSMTQDIIFYCLGFLCILLPLIVLTGEIIPPSDK